MPQAVVFSTPGLIPIEAFTMFGVNAKPRSTNPFGFFGTGLKIAIAVCMRMNQEVIIWRGKDKYTFYVKQTEFRDKQFAYVRMKLEKGLLSGLFRTTYHELPFTTELGKHWELWQAFREFQTNTMDEGGTTYLNNHPDGHIAKGNLDNTWITVTGQKFVDEYHDRDRNFLPNGLTVREGTDRIQVLDKPSKHVYYRSVRVMDLKDEAQFTYNFLMSIDLTEDRTAKYPFLLEAYIAEHIMKSEDEDFIEKTVSKPALGSFERALPYRHTSVTPSAQFLTASRLSPVTGAKEVVKAQETLSSSTRILLTIPKSDVTDEEMSSLQEALENVFGDIKLERQG